MTRTTKLKETLIQLLNHLPGRIDELEYHFNRLKQQIAESSATDIQQGIISAELGDIEETLQIVKESLWQANLATSLPYFQAMWTIQKDDYWLLKGESTDRDISYSIIYAPDLAHYIIEDGKWWMYVIQRMKEAGNRIITLQEFIGLINARSGYEAIIYMPDKPSKPPDPTEPDEKTP